MKVYFFTGQRRIGDIAFDGCVALRRDCKWKKFQIVNKVSKLEIEKKKFDADIIISFLNPYIFSKSQLKKVKYAVNIHPSSPSHPGNDPDAWTIYDGTYVSGATLHFMNEKVDNGPIIDRFY